MWNGVVDGAKGTIEALNFPKTISNMIELSEDIAIAIKDLNSQQRKDYEEIIRAIDLQMKLAKDDDFAKFVGYVVGNYIFEIALSKGVAAAVQKLKTLVKSETFLNALNKTKLGQMTVKQVKAIGEAIDGIRSAIRSSTEALKSKVTKVFSRINNIVDLEYAGVGRVQIDDFSLIDDADTICQQRWKNYCEATWADTAGDLIDDAEEALINGQHYTRNGRIKTLKPDVTYVSNGYKYQTDSLGRITNAKGKLQLCEAPRNDYAQRVVGRIDRRLTDQGGHLIASRFNGSGNLDNLVATDSNLNQGAWKSIENVWANALSKGQEVTIDINVVYNGISQRPTEFIVEYFIDDRKFIRIFSNVAGG